LSEGITESVATEERNAKFEARERTKGNETEIKEETERRGGNGSGAQARKRYVSQEEDEKRQKNGTHTRATVSEKEEISQTVLRGTGVWDSTGNGGGRGGATSENLLFQLHF
jgi:hypothetical protein